MFFRRCLALAIILCIFLASTTLAVPNPMEKGKSGKGGLHQQEHYEDHDYQPTRFHATRDFLQSMDVQSPRTRRSRRRDPSHIQDNLDLTLTTRPSHLSAQPSPQSLLPMYPGTQQESGPEPQPYSWAPDYSGSRDYMPYPYSSYQAHYPSPYQHTYEDVYYGAPSSPMQRIDLDPSSSSSRPGPRAASHHHLTPQEEYIPSSFQQHTPGSDHFRGYVNDAGPASLPTRVEASSKQAAEWQQLPKADHLTLLHKTDNGSSYWSDLPHVAKLTLLQLLHVHTGFLKGSIAKKCREKFEEWMTSALMSREERQIEAVKAALFPTTSFLTQTWMKNMTVAQSEEVVHAMARASEKNPEHIRNFFLHMPLREKKAFKILMDAASGQVSRRYAREMGLDRYNEKLYRSGRSLVPSKTIEIWPWMKGLNERQIKVVIKKMREASHYSKEECFELLKQPHVKDELGFDILDAEEDELREILRSLGT
ncbi:hypothetical protein CBS101457_000133 [Exobasidium rhododendri]|nr:hypothetical protein CBS101457_000133 [Exobasidium rhododendri]